MSGEKKTSPTPPVWAELLVQHLLGRMDPSWAELSEKQIGTLFGEVLAAQQATQTALGRWQDDWIERQIPHGASVLDLGCGTGELLVRLMQRKSVRGQGIELEPEAVFACVARGVPVFQSDLDAGLKGFADQSFDYVVLEETLQTLRHPVEVLQEMLRVGRRGIVSFPNFGFWQVRFDLALRGRMPMTSGLPRPWYDTPNIHLFTVQDFLDWADANRVRIVEGHALAGGTVRPLHAADNLYAEEALLVVERAA